MAEGLSPRHDHGGRCASDVYREKLRFPGIASNPAFAAPPEGNGCGQRRIRTLEESRELPTELAGAGAAR